jgi:hypothetical protein
MQAHRGGWIATYTWPSAPGGHHRGAVVELHGVVANVALEQVHANRSAT